MIKNATHADPGCDSQLHQPRVEQLLEIPLACLVEDQENPRKEFARRRLGKMRQPPAGSCGI